MFKIIFLLSRKSIFTVVRQKSLKLLAFFSIFIVCGGLYLMCYLSKHQKLSFSTSNLYNKLTFNMECKLSYSASTMESSPKCHSLSTAFDESSELKTNTPSDLFFNVLKNGMNSDSQNENQFAQLLSSLMMNGLPLLGIDEFVALSDSVNKNFGENEKKQFLEHPSISDKFRNFLDIRNTEIRITPRSCLTENLLDYLLKTSKIFKVHFFLICLFCNLL
jgi:hypothetical protein